MISSRALLLGRLLQRAASSPATTAAIRNQLVRHGHDVSYRMNGPKPEMLARVGAQVAGGLMWWWVLWHLFHEYEHITGEFDYPDPSQWTNAELGIPSDNE
ncbi:AAEL013960-PA [Aedes aegypti]|uniref:Mitochondrial NADH-ubiquinone oxidoreductase AGGG subunit n=2 Tax=Aedes aegypti TaxID=7159 RepID=Q1HR97_AEDAE|nr:NADH dehydrogenase [ubiquinone] 1 beta subcomplex subunit 2, mitochondrial [Aedes aegypti]ABF18230.1 mitochondrial NADH-ubiquinone oxidoreductase AGGG subunit [Aedes aegypti]EAT33770.1 AAEL013960-PA [Aedes aegypti]